MLAAAKPLSVQVHPNLVQAQDGYAKENRLKIPIDDPTRNYRDPNHKPEIICALTPFWALKGFRSVDEIAAILDELGVAPLFKKHIFIDSDRRSSLLQLFESVWRVEPRQHRALV